MELDEQKIHPTDRETVTDIPPARRHFGWTDLESRDLPVAYPPFRMPELSRNPLLLKP